MEKRGDMSAKLIKGIEVREEILEEITSEVAQIKERHRGLFPVLSPFLVGENPASLSYVTLKIKQLIGWVLKKFRTVSRPI